MPNTHSLEDLLDFLSHAGERGLIPAATASALLVASRNVFSVLSDQEQEALPLDDLDRVIKRFTNKRAKEFTPATLKVYRQRVVRAAELYLKWLENPATFSVKTRTTHRTLKRTYDNSDPRAAEHPLRDDIAVPSIERQASTTGYQTAFPIRPGHVVTIHNIPHNLSAAEAERLAQFIRLLSPA